MANDVNQKKENYSAVVTACALNTFKTGTDAVAIQVKLIENLSTGEKVDRVLVGYMPLTARAIDNTIKSLRDAFDYSYNSFVPLNKSETLAGKECEVTVIYEEYNGELRPKIQFFNASGSFMGRMVKPIPEAAALAIAAQFDGYFVAGGAQAVANNAYGSGAGYGNGYGARSAPARQAPPPAFDGPDNTSDLPF